MIVLVVFDFVNMTHVFLSSNTMMLLIIEFVGA